MAAANPKPVAEDANPGPVRVTVTLRDYVEAAPLVNDALGKGRDVAVYFDTNTSTD